MREESGKKEIIIDSTFDKDVLFIIVKMCWLTESARQNCQPHRGVYSYFEDINRAKFSFRTRRVN